MTHADLQRCRQTVHAMAYKYSPRKTQSGKTYTPAGKNDVMELARMVHDLVTHIEELKR